MRRTALWRMLALSMVVALSLAAAACGGGGGEGGDGGGSGDTEGADQLVGTGASFPEPVYAEMFNAYNEEEGVQVNYDPIGSGGGREDFIAEENDFAGSDAPMSNEEMEEAGGNPQHVPTVAGAVVMAYNVPGIDSEEPLNMSGELVADIYLGEVTSWDDQAIQELNPDAELPAEDIQVVHRSDGSGTTEIFSTYLEAISQPWADEVGASDELDWPTGAGAEGNDGVTAQVENTENAIGYVGLEYAAGESDLPYANLGNSADGPFVEPSTDTASAALDEVVDEIPEDLRLVTSGVTPEAESEDAYPITGMTWLLLRAEQDDLETCRGAAQLAEYMITDGQEFAPEQNYVPMPDSLVEAGQEKIEMMEAEGESCLPE